MQIWNIYNNTVKTFAVCNWQCLLHTGCKRIRFDSTMSPKTWKEWSSITCNLPFVLFPVPPLLPEFSWGQKTNVLGSIWRTKFILVREYIYRKKGIAPGMRGWVGFLSALSSKPPASSYNHYLNHQYHHRYLVVNFNNAIWLAPWISMKSEIGCKPPFNC